MRYAEIVEKAPTPTIPVEELNYGTWLIKYRTKPNAQKKFAAMASHDRNDTIKVEGNSVEDVLDQIKARIDKVNQYNDTALKFSEATIDFNVDFTRELLADGVTGVRFVKRGEAVFLIMAGQDYHAAFGDEIFGAGEDMFVRLGKRHARQGEGATMLYSVKLTGKQLRELGLTPFGRYALDYEKDDDLGNKVYRCIFDSVTRDKTDKVRMGRPGMTVAVS